MLFYMTCVLVAFVAIVAVILINSISSAYAHENTLNINIASACTLSTGGGNYSVSMVDGSTEINANSITTSCNDASGYAIYAVGYSGDSDTGNNTDLINTANSTYNIKTDGSSGTGSNWKLKFTVVSDATIAGSYNTYQNIPSTYTKVASFSANTASGIITPHYQINLTGIQQPGTYTGQVKYVLVHPSTELMSDSSYTISYNANGGTGTMDNSTGYNFEDSTLSQNTLTPPTGYSFNGWCTVQDTNQTPQTTCSGTVYDDEDTIPSSTVVGGGTLSLYAIYSINTYDLAITFAGAGVSSVKICTVSGNCTGADLKGTVSTSGGSVSGLVYNTAYYLYPSYNTGYTLSSWAKTDSASGSVLSSTSATNPSYTMGAGNGAVTITGEILTISNSYYMQDVASCGSSIAVGTTATLRDKRDEQEYTVAKLADGKCWMTKNLNIAGGTAISCETTDCENYTIPTNQGWQSGGRLPASSTSGFSSDNYAYVYNSGRTACSSPGCYSYYSWDVATIGSGRSLGTANTDAPYSICPKGWILPTTGSRDNSGWKRGSAYTLGLAYGVSLQNDHCDNSAATGKNFYNNAGPGTIPNFQKTGFYDNSKANYVGTVGYCWTSTSYSNSSEALFFNFATDAAWFSQAYNRKLGAPVRCIFNDQN